MAVNVIKGQISNGTISENTCIEDYYLCGKFHGFMKKCTIFWLCRYTLYIIIYNYVLLCNKIFHFKTGLSIHLVLRLAIHVVTI